MADELTTVLSKLPTLRVASRSAAFSLGRSGKRSAREVGTTLGVQTYWKAVCSALENG